MNTKSNKTKRQTGQRTADLGTTRRAVLAAGGTVALGALAGCSALNGLIDRGTEQLVGTTVSAPAAFYPGRPPTTASTSSTSTRERDEAQFFRTGPGKVKRVSATVRLEGREIDLEGWSTSVPMKAQDYNSSRSNKPITEWWVGPDGDDDDDEEDVLAAIQEVELELLGHVMTAQDAVERRDQAEASAAFDAFSNATMRELRPELDRCETGVCAGIRESSDGRIDKTRTARSALDDGDWDTAAAELAEVEEIVLGDIERLDDELGDRRPSRPRFSDLIAYLRDEPTIAERFTVCLPDAKLPGDRGSLVEELTLYRVLAYFAASKEEDGQEAPFHDRYDTEGIEYDDDGCIQLDGPVSLHEYVACQNVLSAELDTSTTANRGIVGYGTKGGAVVSGIVPVAMDKGLRLAFLTTDVTGEIILGEDRDMVMPGDDDASSGSQTLVCPVTVTPADCPCPLPGLFYVRRIMHDGQIIFAGGWVLDEGALYEDSVTLLFDEGPTEVASVTPEDVESDDFGDRIVEQFSRSRSQFGSTVVSGDLAATEGGTVPKAQLISKLDGVPSVLQSGEGRKGLNAVNVKIVGEQGDDFNDPDDDGDGFSIDTSATALDAPLVHLAGAGELSTDEKRVHANGLIDEVREDDNAEY